MSSAARERPSQVTDPTDAPLPEQPYPTRERGRRPQRRVYVVQRGDTLERIAHQFYGDESQSTRIVEANRSRLGDPPVVYPGLRIELP